MSDEKNLIPNGKYLVPKKLKTVHFAGQKIELWLNEQRISKLSKVPPQERPFIRDFVTNLEEMGWTVLIDIEEETID